MPIDYKYQRQAMIDVPKNAEGTMMMIRAISYVKTRLLHISTRYQWRRGAKP